MSEAQYIGVARKFTDEERAEYEKQREQRLGITPQSQPQPTGSPAEAQQPQYPPGSLESYNPYAQGIPQTVTEAQNQHAEINYASQEYADEMTQRIIHDRNGYLANDNYEGMLNKTYTLQIYDYIKRANNGAEDSAWKAPNPQDDLYSVWIPDWVKAYELEKQSRESLAQKTPTDPEEARNQQIVQSVYSNATQSQKAIMDSVNIEHGNWNLMPFWDKAKYLLMPGSNATKMDDSPEWAKYIQNIFPSLMAGGAGAMVGSLIPIPGAGLVSGLVVGGLSYLQGVTDIEIPVINKLLEGLDILSVWTEQGQGAIGAAMSEARNKLQGQDAGLLDFIKTTVDVLQENPYLFDVAKYSYEASADMGFDDLMLFVRNTGAKVSDAILGTEFGQRTIDQISRANIGRTGLEVVDEDTQGYNSLIKTYLPVFEGLVNEAMKMGLTEKEAKQFAHQNMEQYLVNYMGTTGLGRDLVASSIADPQNLIPFVSAKVTEGIGKRTGNLALQNAGQAAAGNPLIDLLPPGVQQAVEMVLPDRTRANTPDLLKTHGSQGFDTIQQTYKENLRSMVDVDNLSGWQKHFAGINEKGRIAEFDPNKTTGNAVVDWFRNLTKTTNETKMFDVQGMTTDFLGSVLFSDDVRMDMIPELVLQATGRAPIGDDSPIARFRNTAMLNTLQEAFSGVNDAVISQITKDVQNYRQFTANRAVIDSVAQQLGMTVDEVFNALDNKGINENDPKYKKMGFKTRKAALDAERQSLFKKIREANLTFTDADGKVIDANKIIKSIDVFRTVDREGKFLKDTAGRRQYSQTYLKASIMENVASLVDDYNLKKYGIKPDHWAVRTSNLAKSMQSIALLNFSSSYMVNNFLNNILTRSVAGVGGIDPDYVNTVNAKRGLFFSRDSDTYSSTQQAVKGAKKVNDTLQKFDEMYNNVAQKKLLKGVNNIPIENLESNAAFNIGANRYWASTWGNMIPQMPEEWKSLGITEAQGKQIYKAALDSPNLETFRNKLMGEFVIPGAVSTLEQMIANKYGEQTGKIVRDYFSTKPWITDKIDSFLETGDERIISIGFDELAKDITRELGLENVVEMESTFDSLRTRYADEGIGAAATAFLALNDLYSKIWINQTHESGNAFLARIMKNMSPEDFDTKYKTVTDLQTNDYHIARGYTIMNIAALIDGLGIEHDIGLDLLSSATAFYDIGEEYIKARHEIYQTYGREKSKSYDFKRYKADSIEACTKALNAQLEATKTMNKAMVDYLRANLGSDWTGHIDAFEKSLAEVMKLQEAENAAEIKDLTRRIDTNYKKPRFFESLEQEPARKERKTQISQGYENAGKLLKQMEGAMEGKLPVSTKTADLASTLKMELLYEEGKAIADKAGSFLQKYQKNAEPSEVYKPLVHGNRNVISTFREYAASEIAKRAASGPISMDVTVAQRMMAKQYLSGDAVPLGSVNNPYTSVSTEGLKIGEKYNPVNPAADLTKSRFMMAQTAPFYFGDKLVTAGVYENGKLIGYITPGMQESVTVDGVTFAIAGISKKNPNTLLVYVDDKIREVTPGKPNNVSYTIYAKENFHPGGIGTAPDVEPLGRAALESSAGIRQALDFWKEQAISDLHNAQNNGSFYGNLTDAQKMAIYQWMDNDLRQAYNSQRYQTQRYAETMVDASLLNYSKRYGFDNVLTMIMPYQFWMTRSLANWGKRMISQPAWFSMYARLQKLIEKNKKDFLPTRLEGLVGIPMPNMGDGMGDSFFMDIANIVFPFQQFYKATDYFEKNLNTVHQNTLTRIEEMYQEGIKYNGKLITQDEYYDAMESKGDLYWSVFREEQANDESDTTTTGLLGTFLGYPVWFDALRKHMQGKDKDISYSPMFQLGSTIKATGDNTWFEGLTDLVGGALQAPETALRKALGIQSNPDGNFADYGIVSNIANMLTSLEISEDDALNAIAEGEGNKIWDEALYRYRQAQAYRKQGGALMTEIGQSIGGNKETSLGQLAGSAAASIFGAKILPEGELAHRKQQALLYQIRESGDEEARKQFWKDYPTYSVHNYAYEDDPEQRLHDVLIDNLSNAYYALPDVQKTAVRIAFSRNNDRFEKLFLDPDTRAYDHLENSEIIEWTRAMQGNVPNLREDQITGPMQNAVNVAWYADSIQAASDKLDRDMEQQFPGWKTKQDGYYDLAPELREQYLLENPDLQGAWDYRDAAYDANPALETYRSDRAAQYKVSQGQYDNITDAILSQVNDWTQSNLKNHIQYGWKLNASAEKTLKRVYTELHTNVPYETWLKSLVK